MRRLQIKSKSKIKKKSRGYLSVSFNYYFYYCFLHKGVSLKSCPKLLQGLQLEVTDHIAKTSMSMTLWLKIQL